MRVLAVAIALALLAPAAAQAHVTLQPNTAPAGGYVRLDVRVPNERDDAGTTKVDVQLPPGFVAASYEPVPGWDVTVTRSRITSGIRRSSSAGRVRPERKLAPPRARPTSHTCTRSITPRATSGRCSWSRRRSSAVPRSP